MAGVGFVASMGEMGTVNTNTLRKPEWRETDTDAERKAIKIWKFKK
jgi:hypothetical protein